MAISVLKVLVCTTFLCILLLLLNRERLKPHQRTTLATASQNIDGCPCSRDIPTPPQANSSPEFSIVDTTCGPDAFERGSGQKVIAYSYYGDPNTPSPRHYFQGISRNALKIAKYFPLNWTMRVYHNLESHPQLCQLACQYPHLDFCDIRKSPMFGHLGSILPTLWRFLPMVDDQVSMVLFRDLDSLISHRETMAVEAWIQSKHPVHIMRDHPDHDMEILAGMWGVKVDPLRHSLKQILLAVLQDSLAQASSEAKANDQMLLSKYFWPWAQDVSLQHDSYTCQLFPKTKSFPTERETGANNFIGVPFVDGTELATPCPDKCRPKDHRDWELC